MTKHPETPNIEVKKQRSVKLLDDLIEYHSASLQPFIAKSKELQASIANAKTNTKKTFYKKKLKKNNTTVMGILVELERTQTLKTMMKESMQDEEGAADEHEEA